MQIARKIALLLTIPALAAAQQQSGSPAAGPQKEPAKHEEAKPEQTPAPEAKPSITHHKITVRGNTIQYTATAVRIPIKDEQGALPTNL